MHLVFETHSISEDNERGFATGWLHGRLSHRGRDLAAALGGRRPRSDFDVIFASDLGRAVETAVIAYGDLPVDLRLDWRLRECNYGALNGAPVEELDRVRRQHVNNPFPQGESYVDVVLRMRSFLRDLKEDCSLRSALIIGHSATRWSLDNILRGVPLEKLVSSPFAWQEG